jgi:hypothetical protein
MNIRLQLLTDSWSGLVALDGRRALGLPDNYILMLSNEHRPSLKIDEAFARAWFEPEQNDESGDGKASDARQR